MLVVSGLCFVGAGMLPIVGMLSSWLFPMFLGGWMIGCQRLKDTEGELRFEDLFAGFSQHLQAAGIASLIYLGASVVVTMWRLPVIAWPVWAVAMALSWAATTRACSCMAISSACWSRWRFWCRC
jgi:hypothetical protein